MRAKTISDGTGYYLDQQSYADLIVNYLYFLGVRRMFGVPGGAIEPLFNALARHKRRCPGGIKLVVSRHEAGAAFMAAGYARETGNLGVCCSTTGPGATNLVTGIATAFAERDPVLVITPQTALRDFGRLALQDSSDVGIDIVGMFAHCTRYNSLVSHRDQLEGKLLKAIIAAFSKPRGPVHLSIPMDILKDESAPCQFKYDIHELMQPTVFFDALGYSKLVHIVKQCQKLVLLIGDGCRDGAIEAVIRFAEITNSSVVATPSGKTWVNAYHPLYKGVFGFAGHNTARDVLLDPDVDLLIAVGSNLNEFDTSAWDKLAILNNKLVHIDSTFNDFAQSPMARLHVFGDLNEIFQNLNSDLCNIVDTPGYTKKLAPLAETSENGLGFKLNPVVPISTPYAQQKTPNSGIVAEPVQQTLIKPQWLMQKLPKVFPLDTRYVIDAGNAWAWAIHYLNLRSSGNLRIGLGFGTMTWAIGNAIGVASAAPDKPVVVITGDGAMLMSGQEITVAIEQQLPVLFIVLNDQALGMVKHGQRLGGGEPIGYQLPTVDFAAMARAMGADGYTVRSNADFDQLDFADMLSRPGPCLIDTYIDPEEIPPMGVRMRVLDRRQANRPDREERRTSDQADSTAG